ncbi:MAG: septum formation initiator family protein [Solirubrobacterales bacterium]|nr:septum formation initiator family protein [Solirubrobacterales bacterium]
MIVLVVVAGLYVQHTIEYFTTRSNAVARRAIVYRLARQNAGLRAQLRTLSQASTIKAYARSLGMVQAGERPYVVLGLPGNGASSSGRHTLR